ncbi:MAG TPA: hypothetical protein VII75_15095 [Thermoanaerobaculia bacterium]
MRSAISCCSAAFARRLNAVSRASVVVGRVRASGAFRSEVGPLGNFVKSGGVFVSVLVKVTEGWPSLGVFVIVLDSVTVELGKPRPASISNCRSCWICRICVSVIAAASAGISTFGCNCSMYCSSKGAMDWIETAIDPASS